MEIKRFEDLCQADLKLTFGKRSIFVSIFMIDGLMIDTGPSKKHAILLPLFNEWNMEEVILTHHHEDHTGLANWIQQNKKIPIYIHKSGIAICKEEIKLPYYRKVFFGGRESFKPIALNEVHQTENYTWDIIHTPGHAHDHVALYNREKSWLFGGDLFVESSPKSLFAFESIPEIIGSLRKILEYDFDTYICSHAGVKPKGRQLIEKKLDYLVSIEQEVLQLYGKGMTPQAIRKQLFPKQHVLHYLSLFENSPKHFVNSILTL